MADLSFLFGGWGGDCFKGQDTGGGAYFIKVGQEPRDDVMAPSDPDFYLPLMQQLHGKRILHRIPHIIPTRNGDLSIGLDSARVTVTGYIDGVQIGEESLSDAQLSELARSVGVLHGCLPRLTFAKPLVDTYEIPFDSRLRLLLDPASRQESQSSEIGLKLDRALADHAAELLVYLSHLDILQRDLSRRDRAKVVCHTDIHAGNLMNGSDGSLYILDWENACIGSPEQDLIFFAGDERFWDVFWPHYRSEYSEACVDPIALEFFFYRRHLEDIADFIIRIKGKNGTDEQDNDDLQEIEGCIADLSTIPSTIEKVRKAL
jgi:spectinomycin phosphotransferase